MVKSNQFDYRPIERRRPGRLLKRLPEGYNRETETGHLLALVTRRRRRRRRKTDNLATIEVCASNREINLTTKQTDIKSLSNLSEYFFQPIMNNFETDFTHGSL
jgi:hypothetical protein